VTLARSAVKKPGLTINDLLAAEVGTADGQLLHANANIRPDLFWALRGGGGNFSVATRFRFRLHPLSHVVGGILVLPASAEVVAGFIAMAEAAPEELSIIANVMPARLLPFLPAERYDQLVIMAPMVYAVGVGVKPMPYPDIYPPEDPDFHPPAVGHTMFLDKVDRHAAETIVEYLQTSDASRRAAQLRVLGGAMARVAAEATAFAHRGSAIMATVASFYVGPADKPAREAWVEQFAAALSEGHGRLCRLPHRRGLRPRPPGIPGVHVGPTGPGQGSRRPHEPLPPQPQHLDGDRGAGSVKPDRQSTGSVRAGARQWQRDASSCVRGGVWWI
jgi:hypothetical protein